MLCKDIMKTDIECVSPATSIEDAAGKMRDQNVGFLPVCDEGMKTVGTVTDRDIAVRLVAEGGASTAPVESIMTRDIIYCRPEDDLNYARELMAQSQVSRIICANRRGRIEGIISLSDITALDEQLGAATLREVSAREARGDSHREYARPQ
jgi:CBS domain-containing protein